MAKGQAKDYIVAKGQAKGHIVSKGRDKSHVVAEGHVVSVDCVNDGFLYSPTKFSAIFAEVEGCFGIHNNQLGTVQIAKWKEIWSKLCSLRR
jgi:hypothetical protein